MVTYFLGASILFVILMFAADLYMAHKYNRDPVTNPGGLLLILALLLYATR